MSKNPSTSDPIATISPTFARRMVSFSIILSLGFLLVYIAVAAPPTAFVWRVLLLLLGLGTLVLAERLRRATLLSLMMTETALVDSAGRVLCDISDVASIDRGTFAFKPSNGFLIRTKSRQTRVWQPGLWWRFGRRIGVGGATSAGQAKFMAELIAIRIESNGKP